MRVAVFFICLYYLLLGGYNYIGTAAPYSKSYSQNQQLHHPKQQKFTIRSQSTGAAFGNIDLNTEDEYLLGEKAEDDDVNNSMATRHKLLSRLFLSLSYLFLLNYLYKCFKALPHSYIYSSSPKYITQRVLRI